MNKTKSLAAQVVGAAAIVTLIGTSAFAESRHSDATEHDHSRQSDHRGSRDGNRQSREQRVQRDNRGSDTRTFERHDSANTAPRTFDRGELRGNQPQTFQRGGTRNDSRNYQRNDSRNYGNYSRGNTQFDRRTQPDTYRNNRGGSDRSWGNYRSNRPSFDSRGRRDTFIHGRVSRFLHERGGYRVWLDGGLYPIWIPEARISLFPNLRVGLSLGFGGYYDPSGYLDAYDYYDGGYGGGYAGIGTYAGAGTAYSSGLLRGTVESVDYRNRTLVLRDDVTGNFVTTLIRDRRLESLRPGDYAEISGDWSRNGVFEGLRLEDEQGGRY
jgi:hypothetical protein